MLSVFMTASSARSDDEGIVRCLGQLPEIGGRAAPHTWNGIGGAAFVDAETAIHPVDLTAILFRLAHQGSDRVFRDEMVLLLDTAAMHRVCMRRLRSEGLQYRPLISEDVDVVTALGREIDQPQGRRRTCALIWRIHDGNSDGLRIGHGVPPSV